MKRLEAFFGFLFLSWGRLRAQWIDQDILGSVFLKCVFLLNFMQYVFIQKRKQFCHQTIKTRQELTKENLIIRIFEKVSKGFCIMHFSEEKGIVS